MAWEGVQRITGHGGLVTLGDGAVVPPKAQLTFDGAKGSPDLTMDFEIRDGRPECVAVILKAKPDGRGIRTADLALFNVDTLAIAAFSQLGNIGVGDETRRRQTYKDIQEARLSRRGAVTRAELEEVARVYRDHVTASPTRAVAMLLGHSERTAARRVQQAREAGLLPKTSPGKRKA